LFYICEKAEIKDIKLQRNRKILTKTVLPGRLLNIQGGQFLFPRVYINIEQVQTFTGIVKWWFRQGGLLLLHTVQLQVAADMLHLTFLN
jgi:hypothetical protein